MKTSTPLLSLSCLGVSSAPAASLGPQFPLQGSPLGNGEAGASPSPGPGEGEQSSPLACRLRRAKAGPLGACATVGVGEKVGGMPEWEGAPSPPAPAPSSAACGLLLEGGLSLSCQSLPSRPQCQMPKGDPTISWTPLPAAPVLLPNPASHCSLSRTPPVDDFSL